jgi:ribokinase
MDVYGPRVIVAGSINMDIVARVNRHPLPGETVSGKSLAYFPGGKGANQAVAAARAGADVHMVGAVGNDAFGPQLLSFLRDNFVDTTNISRRPDVSTGTALIVVDSNGENSIVYVGGANDELTAEEVAATDPHNGDVLVAEFETPLEATEALFRKGRSVGATCILNPAPARSTPSSLMSLVDVLVVNETELTTLSGMPVGESPAVEDVRLANDSLSKQGFVGCLVATLGSRGVVAFVGDRNIRIPGRKVKVLDTTGAGDCFTGYLASYLAMGYDIDRSLKAANVAASISVQRHGAGPSMPAKSEVDKIVEDQSTGT